jgi:Xaa-Pro aminopeptidase
MYKKRIQNLQNLLDSDDLDAVLITNNSNIFYLSGLSEFPIEERDGRILITKKHAYILTDFRYTEAVLHKAPHLELLEISYINSLVQAFGQVVSKDRLKTIGIEGDSITVNELSTFTSSFSGQNFKPVEKIIGQLRMQKDPEELSSIKKACELTDKAFDFIVRHVKSGVAEKELAWEIEKYIKEKGGTLAFPSIVAFGAHAAIPHHSPTDQKLSKSEQSILFDMGAKVDGYASDMTRTIFLKTPAQNVSDAYSTVLKIQTQAIKEVGNYKDPNFETSSVANNVNAALQEKGYPPVPHGLGHGVGIDVHESPMLSPASENPLHENMVVTVEPGIYIPGEFGIRIEDTIALGDKAVPLTKSPKSLTVIPLTD